MKKILSFFAAILFAAGMMADPVVLPATLDVSNVSFRSEGMPDFTLAEGDYAGTYFDMGAHDSANDTLLYAEWDVTIQPIKYNVAVVVYNTNSWRVQLDLLNQSDEVVKAIRYKGSSGQCGQYAIGALDLSDLAAGNYKVRVHAATAWSAMKLRDVIFEADYQGVSVALPGTLTPAYALLSSGASVANNAIAFAPSTAPSEYATWNVSFAEAGEYTVSIDFTAPNGHTYGVALLSADGATQIGAVAEAQAWDTGVKELGTIAVPAAGNYVVKLTNATQWSEAVLNSITFAAPAPVDEWAKIIFTAAAAAADIAEDAVYTAPESQFALTLHDEGNKMSIDANDCRFGTAEAYSMYNYRIKSGGASSSTKNYFTLNIPAAGILRIAPRTSSNNDSTRVLVIAQGETELYNAVVKESQAIDVQENGNAVKVYPYVEVNVAAGEVRVSYSAGMNFYAFAFKATAEEPLSAVPTTAAPVPTWPADQVKSLYSDTYTFAPASLNSYNEGWWDQPTLTIEEIEGNHFLHYNGRMTGMIGWQFGDISASIMEYLHIDVWPSADATFNIGPTSPNPTVVASVPMTVEAGKWNAIDIPLTDLLTAAPTLNLADIFQNQFTGYSALTDLSIDNVYFYRTTPYVDEVAPANFTAVVEKASFFGGTIKANATDESGAVSYTVLNGTTVIGSGAAASGADAKISVAGLNPGTAIELSVIAKDDSNNADTTSVTLTTLTAPAPATAPAAQAIFVKSLYSDVYELAVPAVNYMEEWWMGAPISTGKLADNDNVIFYDIPGAEAASFGWSFEDVDASEYPYLHLSIYPLAAGSIEVYPVQRGTTNEAPYHRVISNLVANQWNDIVLDFSDYDMSAIKQLGWCNYYTAGGFFVDNVYFSARQEATAATGGVDRRINAYGLNVVEGENDHYTFTFNANIAPAEANFIFYNEGVEIGSVAIANPVAGLNTKVLAINEIPEGENLTWAVELKAAPVYSFNKLAEGESLMKCHLAIDNSPESNYFGRMYVANRAGSGTGGIYVYNQDYTVHTSNTLAGQPKWQSMGRPSVAVDGTVYIGDWGDGHGGVYVMDPATLTATCLFQGTQASNGLWTNAEGTAMGSSTAAVGVYGEGANTVLYAMNEDASTAGATLYAHGVNVYQLGQADGSVLNTWSVAPTKTFALLDNAAQMFVINPTSKGAFFSCSRAKPNNTAGARSLQFYNTNGERTFVAMPSGATADLTGSLGGGCAVSPDENTLAIVDGDGNILVYAITWAEATPALKLMAKYTTEFAALGSLVFDYAGNIVTTAGANYNNTTANHLVAYGVPTLKNEIIVPAKSTLVVDGTKTATFIDNTEVKPMVVEKIIRNGQVYIVRDGVVYTVTGTRVQ